MSAERSLPSVTAPARKSRLVWGSACALIIGLLAFPSALPVAAVTSATSPLVAVVVPLSVQSGAEGFIRAEDLAFATSPGGYLTRMLNALINQPVAIAVDPMIIVSIRILGSAAPPSAVAWLERLSLASNEIFPLSYADSDVTLGLQAGSDTVLEPQGLEFAVVPGRFSDVVPTQTPTPTNGAVASLPSTEELLSWNYTRDDLSWPVANTVTAVDLEKIAASGFSTTLLSSENVDRQSDSIAVADVDSHRVLVSDSALSELFFSSISLSDASSRAQSVTEIASVVAASASRVSGPSSFVIALDRGVVSNPTHVTDSLVALSRSQSFTVTTVASVLSANSTAATVLDSPHSTTRVSMAAPLLSNESADADFARVAIDPSRITDERRIRLLASLSPQWSRYPGGWGVATKDFLSESVALRSSVRIVESSEITFAADRGMLPITVRNDLDQGVKVFVSVRPRTPLLSIDPVPLELDIEPDSQRKALIPAEALSNGTVELVVSIRNSAGYSVGQPTSVTTRVQAGWETPVTFFLGVLLVIIFAVGIVRTVRRRRNVEKSE
ncbi:MAG: DUF6049 family protein [Microbacteriaceae bacterium]